ncbi:hypothetical protein OPQ81_006278 [Rhizoctonia solani]|nr:hypothetical protein OPQ81_006278 [Rhizoctonia solani]
MGNVSYTIIEPSRLFAAGPQNTRVNSAIDGLTRINPRDEPQRSRTTNLTYQHLGRRQAVIQAEATVTNHVYNVNEDHAVNPGNM